MSLAAWTNVRSIWFSLIESLVFLALTSAYFAGVPRLWSLLTGGPSAWAWVIPGAVYLAGVTIYWAPGEEKVNESEIRGFVVAVLLVALVGAVYIEAKHGLLSAAVATFWERIVA